MGAVPRRLVFAIVLGTLLNPLNSSMIAVALVTLHREFRVELGTSTWLISGFYLAGAVGQPLMGRLADILGARRVFLTGLSVAGVVAVLAPLSPSFGWLVAARVVQAFATSTAYPSGLGMIRAAAGGKGIPAQALAMMSVAASVSAALGPTIGGLILSVASWQGIFLVNVPITALGIVLGLRWLPDTPPSEVTGAGLAGLDVPGVLLFAATLTSLLAGLLSVGSSEAWILLAGVPLLALLLIVRELRTVTPFFDVRLLVANPVLISVFLQFAAVTFVFYSFFFGLPIWLEEVRGFDPRAAGLLILPVTGLGVIATPIAAALISRRGTRSSSVIGSVVLFAGSALLLTFGPGTPVLGLVAVGLVLGVPNGFNNMGLQAALYEAAPPARTSWAAGQFQTFRYVGAILSSTLLGAVFRQRATTDGLHSMALLLVVVSFALVISSLMTRRTMLS
ncbi:MAG: MFS transporter [Chloroflexi bacterium]|nr:MAG: MFS transporter [Chloroflexota bacterium]